MMNDVLAGAERCKRNVGILYRMVAEWSDYRPGSWGDQSRLSTREAKAPSVMTGLLLGCLERVMGIEPTALAWEARVLPLYDARSGPKAAFYALRPGCSILG